MATQYRLEVGQAGTPLGVYQFLPDFSTFASSVFGGNISAGLLSVEANVKKDKNHVSSLTARLSDPAWNVFNQIPDPAFQDVPVRLYLSPPGKNDSPATYLVFSGIATAYHPGFPSPNTLTIDAHDKSIKLRRQQRLKTFKGKTSIQLAQEVCNAYGLPIDTSNLGTAVIKPVSVDIGFGQSDWDQMCRALASDGLEVHVTNDKLVVQQSAVTFYGVKFKRGEPPVVKLDATITHIHGPGDGGDKSTGAYADTKGTSRAVTAAELAEAAKLGAGERTHRRPLRGPWTSVVSHAEDIAGNAWSEAKKQLRRRKDEATLVCTTLPDIGLIHTVALSGFGGKIDGGWWIQGIKHTLVGTEVASTSLSLHRGPAASAQQNAGVNIIDSPSISSATKSANLPSAEGK